MRLPDQIERLYMDFDSFFASVEQQDDPALIGQPVGVIPLDSEHTSLIAASKQAKAMGATRGVPVREARQLCPGIALRTARHDRYVEVHNAILASVGAILPVRRVWSVDEVECALMGREQREPEALAARIKQRLAEDIGPAITCSIGFAPNQFLAKVAAEMNKPDGLVILRPADLPGPLFTLKLTDLPGVARSMERRLLAAGVTSVEALWNLSPKHARALWGSVNGERFWAQLRGYDVEIPETQRMMFGHGRVLSRDWRGAGRARACCRLLAAKAARRMRRAGFHAQSLSLSLTWEEAEAGRWAGEVRFDAAADDHTVFAALEELFAAAMAAHPRRRIRKVHVMLHRILPAAARVDNLFEGADSRSLRRRREAATGAMDELNKRYQTCVLSVGPRAEPPGGYAGAKIAFGRIPDMEEF